MSYTLEELKELIKDREDPDFIIELLGATTEVLIESGCLDDLILKNFDSLTEYYMEENENASN